MYATVGRGLETFAKFGILSIGGANIVIDNGKIIFNFPTVNGAQAANVLGLKGIERLFAKIVYLRNPGWSLSEFLAVADGICCSSEPWFAAFNLVETLNIPNSRFDAEGTDPNDTTDSPPASKIRKLDSSQTVGFRTLAKTFRVNCRCSGRLKKRLNIDQFCGRIGRKLSESLKWQIDLRRPSFEVCVHINDDYLIIGIPVTSEPLSKRTYHLNPGLRATVCDLMVHLASLTSGDVVLDPLCGLGTLLVECGVQFCNKILLLGADIHKDCLLPAFENLEFASKVVFETGGHRPLIGLTACDVMSLCYRSSTVDCVISDVPFGQQHGTVEYLGKLYPKMIAEMHRVLVPNSGRAILLCGRSGVSLLLKAIGNLFLVKSTVDISLGNTEGAILQLSKFC